MYFAVVGMLINTAFSDGANVVAVRANVLVDSFGFEHHCEYAVQRD